MHLVGVLDAKEKLIEVDGSRRSRDVEVKVEEVLKKKKKMKRQRQICFGGGLREVAVREESCWREDVV